MFNKEKRNALIARDTLIKCLLLTLLSRLQNYETEMCVQNQLLFMTSLLITWSHCWMSSPFHSEDICFKNSVSLIIFQCLNSTINRLLKKKIKQHFCNNIESCDYKMIETQMLHLPSTPNFQDFVFLICRV